MKNYIVVYSYSLIILTTIIVSITIIQDKNECMCGSKILLEEIFVSSQICKTQWSLWYCSRKTGRKSAVLK